jgi:hypothetical protein
MRFLLLTTFLAVADISIIARQDEKTNDTQEEPVMWLRTPKLQQNLLRQQVNLNQSNDRDYRLDLQQFTSDRYPVRHAWELRRV